VGMGWGFRRALSLILPLAGPIPVSAMTACPCLEGSFCRRRLRSWRSQVPKSLRMPKGHPNSLRGLRGKGPQHLDADEQVHLPACGEHLNVPKVACGGRL
jgi:hypothetical protein